MDIIVSTISVAVGIAGLVYAIMVNREKVRLEKLIASNLRRLGGDIQWVQENANWADQHYSTIQEVLLRFERSEDVNTALNHTQLGARDSVAAERGLKIMLNHVLSLQEGMFGTKIVTCADDFTDPRREE